VHHEAAAGYIADAYYRVRRSPLATLTSCGPGSAQLLVALGAALMDSSAVLAITGDVPATQFGRAPFQELGRHYQADFPGAVRPYVKRSFQATRADQLPVMLPQAMAAMLSGRPGPVNLDVPLNVFAEPAPAGEVPVPGSPPRSAAAPQDVARALDARARAADAVPLQPARVLSELRAALPADGILLSDVGAHHNWIVQEWPPGGPGTLLQSWGFAAMGFGMAGVLGARLAAPSRAVAAVVGDGGFLMLPSVVATAVEYGLPAVWVVWNNGGYISIRDQHRGYFGPEIATSFTYAATGEPYRCDFAAMARAMGADGMRAQAPGEVGAAVAAALDRGRPAVIDVPVDADVPQPAVATWELPPLPAPEPDFGWPDP
jgi:thiamine pyrophosphate-dependent acetolactate synthase large subunit-like protein